MIRLKNVLVATDFSEQSKSALEYGRELARTYDATLHVVHVVEDIVARYSTDISATMLVGALESLEASASSELDALVTDDDRRTLRAHTMVFTSVAPAETIVAYAKTQAVDVIVIGTHGRSGLAHLFMGSVAERVVRFAPCPVLTVHHPEHEFIAPDAMAVVSKV
jgi:nucleotide-binding universal stress UspA family protein